jgi:hypothetical protein
MKPLIRECSNCHHFKPNGELAGDCTAPLPNSVKLGLWSKRRKMIRTAGFNCQAHRMRVVRKGKTQVEQVI